MRPEPRSQLPNRGLYAAVLDELVDEGLKVQVLGVVNDAQNEAFDEIVNGTIGPQMSTLPLNGGQ